MLPILSRPLLLSSIGIRSLCSSASPALQELRFQLLTSDSCTLCFHFKKQFTNYIKRHEFDWTFEEIDIHSDRKIFDKYKYDIPVLLLEDKVRTMIAVHAGAGCHPDGIDKFCKKVIRGASGDVLEAIKAFENDPMTNCGFGSNLSLSGRVQCEAAFMTSDDLRFGAVACVSTIKNPIVAAKQLVVNQIARKQGGLIAPSILIGEGAEKFAAGCDIELCAPDGLVSPRAEMTYEKALRKLAVTEERLDTVGAVSIDNSGLATSGISSGGIILKFDGRVGHSSQFGGGVWAEKRGLRSVAVSTSGCGEALARTHFAQKLGESLLEYDPSDGLYVEAINETFKKGFLESPLVTKSFIPEHRLAGGVAIIRDEDEGISEVIVFHNTKHFAYAFSDGSVSKRGLSELKEGQQFCAKSFQL